MPMKAMASHHCVSCSVRGADSFCSLSAVSLADVEALGTTVYLSAKEPVLREGFSAEKVYVVCQGTVKITTMSADGDLLILRVAGPGSVLGLASVLRGPIYRVGAETLEDCELKSIPRVKFLEMMKRFPDVGLNTAVAVSGEYEAALLSARRLALSTSAAGKLASVLLEWGRMKQGEERSSYEYSMPLTHEELGCMAGLSRETVTRLLGRFKGEGLMEQRGGVVLIREPGKMEGLYC